MMNRIDNIPNTSLNRPQFLSRSFALINQLLQSAEDAEKVLAVLVQVSLKGLNQEQNFAALIHASHTGDKTQGPDESIGICLDITSDYLNGLTSPVS